MKILCEQERMGTYNTKKNIPKKKHPQDPSWQNALIDIEMKLVLSIMQ